MGVLKDLVIPTNPKYSFATDPAEQDEYANPVTVANHVVALSNAAIQVTSHITALNKKKAANKAALFDAEHALGDFEQDLLAQFPAGTADRKSNKLLEAYIRQTAFEAGVKDEYLQLGVAVRELQKAQQDIDIQLESAWQLWQVIKLKGEHAQTYLSFKKHEFDQHKYS